MDICNDCNQVNCKCINQLPINSRESVNHNNDYEVSTIYSDCDYDLSTLFDSSNRNNFIYSNATIENNVHDHSAINNVAFHESP